MQKEITCTVLVRLHLLLFFLFFSQPDWSEERELVTKAENLRAEARGRAAMDKLHEETLLRKQEAQRLIVAR